MLKNGFIADIPLIFAAIDPCICCAERTVELVNARSGEETVVRFGELRKLAGELPAGLERDLCGELAAEEEEHVALLEGELEQLG